jgi:hypothetical protein
MRKGGFAVSMLRFLYAARIFLRVFGRRADVLLYRKGSGRRRSKAA